MQLPLQITFQGIPHSDAVEQEIRKKAEKLDRFYDSIMGVRVVVESEERHHHQGKLYCVRIDLTVPGGELVVNRKMDEDLHVAMRDAFDAMRRQLQDYGRKQRGEVKTHEPEFHGTVARIFPEEGYGFIASGENEYYFNAAAVVEPDFERLTTGTLVVFVPAVGKDGPQAVRVVGKKQGHQ